MNIEIFLNSLMAYFIIIDPLGISLIFSALTESKSKTYKKIMAVKAVILSYIIILLFGFFGNKLLSSLGIHIYSFKIAGGFLLFYTAFHMIVKPEDENTGGRKGHEDDISVYPLTIPLMAGPGVLTMTILLFSNTSGNVAGSISVSIAAAVIYIVAFICFMLSSNIKRAIGKSGINIIKRLVGVLLASLSVQFIVDGFKAAGVL
jgi:multiple antibiotic resistance protein